MTTGGAGIQHLAMLTDDAIDGIAALPKRGVDFLSIPDSYYDLVRDRVGEIAEDPAQVKALNILVDRDEDGD